MHTCKMICMAGSIDLKQYHHRLVLQCYKMHKHVKHKIKLLYLKSDVMSKLTPRIPSLISLDDSSVFDRNLLQVEVFYEEFNYESVEETPAYLVWSSLTLLCFYLNPLRLHGLLTLQMCIWKFFFYRGLI